MNTLTNFRRIIRLGAWVAAGVMCAVPARSRAQGQPTPPPPQAASPAEQQPVVVIKKESKLVLVDSVVTDKKGNYVRDLTQNDFKVFEDSKEQPVSTFSTGADAATQANGQRRYLILFFDNSTMAAPDQIQARSAATKFIAANAAPDRLMAVVDFGGSLRIVQNFTANADVLRAAVSGVKGSAVDPNAPPPDVPVTVASAGLPSMGSSLGNAAADFGARSMLLAVRSLAKNLRSIPGRKMVVLFSGGFPLTQENQSELTATIDACNKSNVAVYALDARGLVATAPGGSATRRSTAGKTQPASNHIPARRTSGRPQLLLAAYPAMAMPDPERPGGGGGGGTGGGGGGCGGRGGGGGTGGGGTGGGGTGGGGKGGSGGGGGTGGGGKGGSGGGTGGGGRGGTGGGTSGGSRGGPMSNYNNSPYNQPRTIVPTFPPSASTNQQILAALAEGTGGFTIFNTNDLLGRLRRHGRKQNEFYLLGEVPAEKPEGSLHTVEGKLNRGRI